MKKRVLSMLFALVLLLTLLPVTPVRANSYKLNIAGVDVNDGNKSDILGNGVFSYDPTENRLTVKGNYTYGSSGTMISNSIPNLTIYAASDATITASNGACISSNESITVTGPGKLKINANKGVGIRIYENDTLRIQDADLSISGNYGLMGYYGSSTLSVQNSKIAISAKTEGITIFGGGIYLYDCEITSPEGGVIVKGDVKDADGKIAKTVNIAPKTVTEYDLTIAGTKVTSANAADILGDGVFSFDAAAGKLTVKGDYSGTAATLIYNSIEGLAIYVSKNATLHSSENTIVAKKDLTISGPGKLSLKSDKNSGILSLGGTVTLENADIDVTGNGILCVGSSTAKLLLRNSKVHTVGKLGAMKDFAGGILFDGCGVTEPAGARLKDGSIVDSDGNAIPEVTIAPGGFVPETLLPSEETSVTEYNLTIAGTKVTSDNAEDILGDGVFSYDAAANRLSVKGDCESTSDSVILSDLYDLTVRVEADATLSATLDVIITHKAITITGPGKLTLRSSDSCGLYADYGASIQIEKADVDASGLWGIGGSGKGEKLIVKDSAIHAEGSVCAICDFSAGITLTDCEITEPAGGAIAGDKIADKDAAAAKTVTIGKGTAEPEVFVVTFDENGHGTAPAAQTVKKGTTAVLPEDPEEADWRFVGWFTDAACSVAYDFSESVNADMTLYAGWEKLISYPIYICGVQVNSANAADVLGDGAFSYDEAIRRLTVSGDCISTDPVIRSEVGDLTIFVSTDVDLAADNAVIQLSHNTEITGPGVLTLTSGTSCIQVDHGVILTIDDASIEADAEYGIKGSQKGEYLIIRNSSIHAKGTSGALCDFDTGITLENRTLKKPKSGVIIDGSVVDDQHETAGEITIIPGEHTRKVQSIVLTSMPDRLDYVEGDFFDPSGLVVQALYDDNTLEEVKDYTWEPQTPLNLGDTVEIFYTEDDITVSATLIAHIKAKEKALLLIEITAPPEKTEYTAGESFDPAGMEVTAVYDDESRVVIENYTVLQEGALSEADLFVIISYTEDDNVLTVEQPITVKPAPQAEKVNPFEDVKSEDYFFDAVLWAYYADPQVTNGKDDTHFAPADTVTRGQAVTFLWRAMGKPEPTATENPFEDVWEKDYWYKAVLWANEKGITTGTDDTHFTPYQTCSTAHIVTFLYRTITGNSVGGKDWYLLPEAWAKGAGLLDGISLEVRPGVDCPRCDVVLFLFRQLAK